MEAMERILEKYRRGKFNECLELLNSLPDADDVVENLILENCKIVCESFIRKAENDPDKIYEMQEMLYLFYDKVTCLGTVPDSNYEKLRLVVTHNFIYWLLFYNDDEMSDNEVQEYLEIVSEGISRVSGKPKSDVFYSDPSKKVLDDISGLCELSRSAEDAFMLLEFITILIMCVIKLKKPLMSDCLKIIKRLLHGLKEEIRRKEAVDEFLDEGPTRCPPLFKFGLDGVPELLEKNHRVVDYLHLLEAILLFLQEDYSGSLKSLRGNVHSSVPTLWTYLVVLNARQLEKWDLCWGFLSRSESLVMEVNLKARFCVAKGRMGCVERRHGQAVRFFEEASELSPNCPAVWYFLGEEYGRMGLYDVMLEHFQKLVMVVTDDDLEVDLNPNFETTLLDWIHPPGEIAETEAYYALAVAYGLNESFKEAAEIFEKVLQCPPVENSSKRKRIIQLPDNLTILHEAAVMNLHTGNLVRAEQIAMDAIDRYDPRPSARTEERSSLLCKDAEWLERLIHQELLETDLEPRELSREVIYPEDLVFKLPRNVIGMLIWSEVQRIQDVDDYKQTLSGVFSTFSKYLSRKESASEEELTLVKALAGKTCLKVAAVQVRGNNDSEVEKMYKRALSCNKGDKDALHGYYTYLTRLGRHAEALKLWNTFAKEKPAVAVDSLSSFSLKYFLTDKITKRELDKIQVQIDLTDLKLF